MRKRNILYELKHLLRKGTIEDQVAWCYDDEVQKWSQHYYRLWNNVVTEIPNGANASK